MTAQELALLKDLHRGNWVYVGYPSGGRRVFVAADGLFAIDCWLVMNSQVSPFKRVREYSIMLWQGPIDPTPTELVLSNHFFPNRVPR